MPQTRTRKSNVARGAAPATDMIKVSQPEFFIESNSDDTLPVQLV